MPQDADALRQFIADHRTMSPQAVALMLGKQTAWDARYVVQQIEGWQRLRHKVPSWAACDDIIYPPRLAIEQCSGEAAARYKGEVIAHLFPQGGTHMADLTGGYGVDFAVLSQIFRHATYIEQNAELVRLARHNLPLLGVKNADFIEENAILWLSRQQTSSYDLLYLDPARRDEAGRKTVLIEDCQPDVVTLMPQLLERAAYVVIKLSPMLDLRRALRSLPTVAEVHIFAQSGECKDLLLVVGHTPTTDPLITCADDDHRFTFSLHEERTCSVTYATTLSTYLYEPSPAVLKAGAFRTIATRYGLAKLSPDAHLYTSSSYASDFPGRRFRIVRTADFSKSSLRSLDLPQRRANLTVRGFPATVAALRRRLRLREGGDDYLFATTLSDGRHVLIHAQRARD